MELLGYKANMNDLQAALLLPQLPRLQTLLSRREAICQRYQHVFATGGIDYPKVIPGTTSARHIFTFWAPRGKRDEMMAQLQELGIGVAVNFRAIHLLAYYRTTLGCKIGDLPVAEEIGDRTITIPMYTKLTDEEVEYVAQTVSCVYNSLK